MQRLDLAADRAGPFDHAHAELGGHRAPAAANEQLHAELGFELAHVLGDVRLDRVEAVGGGRETALLGHREQGFELANVHDLAPLPSRSGAPGGSAQLSLLTIDPIASTPLTDGLVIGFT